MASSGPSARLTLTLKKEPTPTQSLSPTPGARSRCSVARPSSPTRHLCPCDAADRLDSRGLDLPGSGVFTAAVQGRGRLVHRCQPDSAFDRLHGHHRLGRRHADDGRNGHPAGRRRYAVLRKRFAYLCRFGLTTGTGNSGTYAIQVFVQDVGGSRVTVTNTATVADNSIALTGALNPGFRQRPLDGHRRRHQRGAAQLHRHV